MDRAWLAAGLLGILAISATAGEGPGPGRGGRGPGFVPGPVGGPGPAAGEAEEAAPAVFEPGLPPAPTKRPRPLTLMERRIEVLCRILAFRIVESFPSAHPSPLAGLAVRVLRPGSATDELAVAQERAEGLQAKGVHVPGYGIVLTLNAQVREGAESVPASPEEKARPLWERIEETLTAPEKANGGRAPAAAKETSTPVELGASEDVAGRPTWKELVDLIVAVVTDSSPRLEGLPAGESVIVIVHGVEGDIASAIPGLRSGEDAAASVPQALIVALRKADLDAVADKTLDKPTLLTRAVIVIPPPREIEVEPEPSDEAKLGDEAKPVGPTEPAEPAKSAEPAESAKAPSGPAKPPETP